jgi:hypothetical protein
MAVVLLSSGSTSIYTKNYSPAPLKDRMGGFVLVTAPQYKLIQKKKKKKKSHSVY